MYPRVSRHLIRNMDALRKKRRGIQEESQENQNEKPSETIAIEKSPQTQEKEAENKAEILKDTDDFVED